MKLTIGVCLIATVLGFTITASAQPSSSVEDLKNSIDRKLNEISSEKKRTQGKLNDVLDQKDSVKNEETKRNNQIKQLTNTKNTRSEEVETTGDQLRETEKRYIKTLETFKSRLRNIYMNDNYSILDAVAQSQNIVEFANRYEFMQEIAQRDKEVIKLIAAEKRDLEYKKARKLEELRLIQSKMKLTARELKDIANARQNLEQKIVGMNYKLDQLEAEEDQLLAESEKLSKRISAMQSATKEYSKGNMKWPVPTSTQVTSPFGLRYHPVLKYNRMHTGIDIGASYGVSIVATKDGAVKIAEWAGGYGNMITIDHGGGISTVYGHCSVLLVSVGMNVKAGDTIAKIGSTGISTGPHLHFEVRKNGEPTNPMSYF